MRRRFSSCPAFIIAALVVLLNWEQPATAQWLSQDISLSPGWNAVQLLVQPAQSTCAGIFTNRPVEKVFWWRRTSTGMEFDLDPQDLFPRTADWQTWFADNPDISTFGNLMAGEAYLIYVTPGSAPFSLHITGRAVLNPVRWIPNEKNLVGLPAPTNGVISIQEFFAFSPDFVMNSSTATVFRVFGTGDTPQRVFNPASVYIKGGEALWISAGPKAIDYNGPIQVLVGKNSRLLDFGASVVAKSITIKNRSSASRTFKLEHLASGTPPSLPGIPLLLGKTPLLYKKAGTDEPFQPLPDVLVTNLAASSQLELSLMPDPQGLSNGTPGSAWQSLIRVTDADNTQFPLTTVDVKFGVSCDGSVSAQLNPQGLWIGRVTVTDVERAPTREGAVNTWSTEGPVPVSEPFTYRILFHVDENGDTRLLQRALVASRSSGTDTNGGVVAILANEQSAKTYAAQHPDVSMTRVSSTCLPLMSPLGTTNGVFGSWLAFDVDLPYDDPVNPFVHRYHPQHDNLEYDNGVASRRAENVESFTVTRAMRFYFDRLDPLIGTTNRQWGVNENGGRFEETINGLNKTIRTKGTFKVERATRMGVLID